jgi:hypothetical protein
MTEITERLAKAIYEVHKEITSVARDGKNDFFKKGGKSSTYTTIETLIHNLRPILIKHDLVVMQFPVTEQDRAGICTTIMNKHGDKIEFAYTLPVKDAKDPQKSCAAITYARRYALVSMFMIPTEDDDGNMAAKPAEKKEFVPERLPEEGEGKGHPGNAAFVKMVMEINQTKTEEYLVEEVKKQIIKVKDICSEAQINSLREKFKEKLTELQNKKGETE